MAIVEKHYVNDRRIGEACVINGHDAYSNYNADLIGITPSAGSLTQNYDRSVSKSFFNVYSTDFEPSSVDFAFYVGGIDRNDLYTNVSMLIAESKQCVINTGEDTFEYVCVLDSYEVEEQEIEWWQMVTLKFAFIRRLPLWTASTGGVAKTKLEFFNPGVIESGLRIRVKSATQQSGVKVGDVTINTIHANNEFIIDGISGTVTENGVNKFQETDIISFPRVQHGDNVIQCNKAVQLAIEFYPTFIV